MANMSEAFGDITIFCASFDALVDLIQCHLKYEEGAFYSTSLDLFENVSPENRDEIIKIVEKNYELDSTTHDAVLVSDFTATGRLAVISFKMGKHLSIGMQKTKNR